MSRGLAFCSTALSGCAARTITPRNPLCANRAWIAGAILSATDFAVRTGEDQTRKVVAVDAQPAVSPVLKGDGDDGQKCLRLRHLLGQHFVSHGHVPQNKQYGSLTSRLQIVNLDFPQGW